MTYSIKDNHSNFANMNINDFVALGGAVDVLSKESLSSVFPAVLMKRFFCKERELELASSDCFVSSLEERGGHSGRNPAIELWCQKLDSFIDAIRGRATGVKRRPSVKLVRTFSSSKNLGEVKEGAAGNGKVPWTLTTKFTLSSCEVSGMPGLVLAYCWSWDDSDSSQAFCGRRVKTVSSPKGVETRLEWSRLESNLFALLTTPGPDSDGTAQSPFLMRFSEISKGRTRLERFSMGAGQEFAVQNGVAVRSISTHFTRLKALEDLNEVDGVVIGEHFGNFACRGGKRGWAEEAVREVVDGFSSLKTLTSKYRWFSPMISMILQSKLRAGNDLSCALQELAASDGATIGGEELRERCDEQSEVSREEGSFYDVRNGGRVGSSDITYGSTSRKATATSEASCKR